MQRQYTNEEIENAFNEMFKYYPEINREDVVLEFGAPLLVNGLCINTFSKRHLIASFVVFLCGLGLVSFYLVNVATSLVFF
jgi:predicted aminopeptidase